MAKDRNALKSGLFIVVTIAAILAIVVALKGFDRLSEPQDLRAVSFSLKDDVGGLQIGDDVRVGGYKVGVVKDISIVGADDAGGNEPVRVRVSFTFPRRYQLHRDAMLRIQTGVTGPSCLNIEDLGTGEKLPVNVELAGHGSRLGETLAMLSDLGAPVQSILHTVDKKTLPVVNDTVAKFGKAADHASGLVQDARAEVKPAMQKYHTLADRGVEALSKIRDFFGDTTSDFRGTMASLNKTMQAVSQKTPAIIEKVDALLVKVDSTVQSANSALEDIKVLASSAKGVVVGNRGKLDAMIASLKIASDNLKNATAEIRRSPWRLLYKPAPNEMANLNLYDAAREFAEGANDLNDASLALRDALQNKEADKDSVEKLMQRVNKSFEKFQEVEQRLWTRVKE
jgi:ABC-type transporter Mla subunit MlaD